MGIENYFISLKVYNNGTKCKEIRDQLKGR